MFQCQGHGEPMIHFMCIKEHGSDNERTTEILKRIQLENSKLAANPIDTGKKVK